MTDWEGQWAAGKTPWDKGFAAPPLEEYLAAPGVSVRGLRVLVPGCGSGHDVRLLASRGAQVVGLDLSPTALAVARSAAAVAGERYVEGDFTSWDGGEFDLIWEHTCFCALDPGLRAGYARAVDRHLRAGGVFAGVFFLRPWDEGETPEPPPHAAGRDEIAGLFGGFTLEWERVPTRSYPGREGREWLAVFRKP